MQVELAGTFSRGLTAFDWNASSKVTHALHCTHTYVLKATIYMQPMYKLIAYIYLYKQNMPY